MPAFQPKTYQQSVLDSIQHYLRACAQRGDADTAFYETTRDLWQRAQRYEPLTGFAPGMPYFCLRVPTGGGKTWLAAKSVAIVNQALLATEHSLILWLVPSTAILRQTLDGLRERDHPYRLALQEAGPITVIDLDDAKSLTRPTLDTSTVVIVATRQAFQVGDTEIRKVYEASGALMHHFEKLAPAQQTQLLKNDDGTAPQSLANVLRLRRPFVIVDEAHNSRTELAFGTLKRFNPSGILELTATPDTVHTPSNVLHSVSAAELKAEQMIKLPIRLETEPDWQQCLGYALDCRSQLQAAADAEHAKGQPYLRPLVLIQAEKRSKARDTLHVDAVRSALMAQHNIPADEIVIATGDDKGLDALEAEYPHGIADPACPVKYVLTQQALAEGWDCPSAYVLVSMAEVRSSTAVEQLLGRILRQPGATARATAPLNQSYAFVVSRDFSGTAASLRDRLVDGAGFEQQAAAEFVSARDPDQGRLDVDGRHRAVEVRPVVIQIGEAPNLKQLDTPLKQKVAWDKKANALTIKQPLSEAEADAVSRTVSGENIRAAIVEAGRVSRTEAVTHFQTPAERGETLAVPQIALRVQGELQLFDDPEALDYPWELPGYPTGPAPASLEALNALGHVAGGGQIDMTEAGKVSVDFMPDLQRDLGLAYAPEHWDTVRLAAWLCRNLPEPGLTHGSKMRFVSAWLRQLLNTPDYDLARANRQKFQIRQQLEQEIRDLRSAAVRVVFEACMFGDGAAERLSVTNDYVYTFNPQAYAPGRDYDPDRWGYYAFHDHFVGRIGDFDSGEEFECACRLDQLAATGRIKFWMRNLVNKPGSSFFLQQATRRFYPDFVCKLNDGSILVVEYKGRLDDKAREDARLGALWAELSENRCQFVMVRDKNWAAIETLLRG